MAGLTVVMQRLTDLFGIPSPRAGLTLGRHMALLIVSI